MKIVIGSDHAGFPLKEKLRDRLRAAGHDVEDLGATSEESSDYPDFAGAVGQWVGSGAAERGILVCASGVGMAMAANKVPGVRAALGVNEEEVRLTRSHNDANVLTLGAKFIEAPEAGKLIDTFLETPFDGGERHIRRIGKITALEQPPPPAGKSRG